jgi:hypothetical protein
MSVIGRKPRIASTAAVILAALCVALLVAVAAASAAPATGLAELTASAPSAAATTKVVQGTAGADVITVSQLADGSLTVLVNGFATSVPSGSSLVIDAKGGDDQITADATVTTGMVIFGGAGDDQVTCGAGDDYVDAGPGDDVVNGGAGNDVIYGLSGNDVLNGGDGTDYLDGGPGSDVIHGGAGNDILIGGADADTLNGDDGDDVLAGGSGVDTYDGGAGSQRTYAQRADVQPFVAAGTVTWVSGASRDAAGKAIAAFLALPKGTKPAALAFRQRCSSDVQALLSLPPGRRLLLALDAAGRQVSLVRSGGVNQTTIPDMGAAVLRSSGRRGPGSVSTIAYDPMQTVIEGGGQAWMHRPPLVGLYHELIHALNAATGSLQPGVTAKVNNAEFQAVGLRFPGILWDNDGNPATPRAAGNVPAFTENGFRAFLGLPKRQQY